MPSSLLNLSSKWKTHFEKRRLRQISAYNVSTVRDSEKRSIMTNRKSTTGFPTSYRRSAYVTPKSAKKVVQKPIFGIKFNFNGTLLQSLFVWQLQRQSCSITIPSGGWKGANAPGGTLQGAAFGWSKIWKSKFGCLAYWRLHFRQWYFTPLTQWHAPGFGTTSPTVNASRPHTKCAAYNKKHTADLTDYSPAVKL